VLGGATFPEIAFAAMLILLVLMAPFVPRVGGAIGKLFDKDGSKNGGGSS
jgi:hypothetical protein